MRVSIGPAYRRYWGGRDVHEDIRAALPSGSTGETSIWVGDVGRDPPHVKEPGGVTHRVVRRIKGQTPRHRANGSWNYPPLVEVMQEAWLEEMWVYIGRRHNMVAQYISTRPILNPFPEAERSPGERVTKRWRGQPGLWLVGVQGGQGTGGGRVGGGRGIGRYKRNTER